MIRKPMGVILAGASVSLARPAEPTPKPETRTTTRKADRRSMAEELAKVARDAGAHVEIEWEGPRDESSWNRHRTVVKITMARGVCVGVNFDGKTTLPNRWVLSYHFNTTWTDECLSSHLGDVNPHHFRKATDHAGNFDLLKVLIVRAITKCADGTAFSEERKRAAIAKNGGETAAQRKARDDAYRALPEYRVWHDLMGTAPMTDPVRVAAEKALHAAALAAGLIKPRNPTYDLDTGIAPVSAKLAAFKAAGGSGG